MKIFGIFFLQPTDEFWDIFPRLFDEFSNIFSWRFLWILRYFHATDWWTSWFFGFFLSFQMTNFVIFPPLTEWCFSEFFFLRLIDKIHNFFPRAWLKNLAIFHRDCLTNFATFYQGCLTNFTIFSRERYTNYAIFSHDWLTNIAIFSADRLTNFVGEQLNNKFCNFFFFPYDRLMKLVIFFFSPRMIFEFQDFYYRDWKRKSAVKANMPLHPIKVA